MKTGVLPSNCDRMLKTKIDKPALAVPGRIEDQSDLLPGRFAAF